MSVKHLEQSTPPTHTLEAVLPGAGQTSSLGGKKGRVCLYPDGPQTTVIKITAAGTGLSLLSSLHGLF